MASLELIIKTWDEGHFELGEAFKGLQDADVWKRAHPRLLSVGELAGHVAYWEAIKMAGSGWDPDLAEVPIKSPLVDKAFRYYTTNVEGAKSLDLGAEAVWAEVKRVHEEAKAAVLAVNPNSEDLMPGFKDATWGAMLQYAVIHVSYHTGQAYSVRHLLGHETTDN